MALESKRLGHGGDHLLSHITGMNEKTIRRAAKNWTPRWLRIRRIASAARAAGDHRLKKDPGIIPALQTVVEPETAGDPMSDQKWVRSSLRTLSDRLEKAVHAASPPTVARLLSKLKYALHVNAKKIEACTYNSHNFTLELWTDSYDSYDYYDTSPMHRILPPHPALRSVRKNGLQP